MSNIRTVPEHLVPEIQAIVAKVNKRAAKIGAEPFTLSVGEPRLVRVQLNTDAEVSAYQATFRMVSMVDVAIVGPVIKVGGHSLLGRIDFEGELTIANTRPGGEMPLQYRTATRFCEHCSVNRKRNAVFVFERDTGGHIQVGTSCLKDFLGHDPERALWAAREYAGLWGDIDEEIGRGAGRAPTMISVVEVMVAAAYSVRLHGFISKGAADERNEAGNYTESTSATVHGYLFDRERRAKYKPTPDDFAKAKAVIEWVRHEVSPKEHKSDYEHNAVELVGDGQGAVTLRRIGLLVSLVGVFNRANEARIERESQIDAFIGEPKQRRQFQATYRGASWFDTNYGRMCAARFATAEGLVVYKGSSPFWPDTIQAGDAITFTGTIKEHAEYKGGKQTLVARCKMLNQQAA